MKNVKRNTIILMIVTLCVLIFILKDDFSNIMSVLVNANFLWIIVALLFMFAYWAMKTFGLYFIAKEYKKDISWVELFQQIIITHFFCGITPFSTGGEPMAIYMLKKSGIKIANATSIIVQNFIMYQLALVLYGLTAVILNYNLNIFADIPLLRNLVMLGFIVNLAVAGFLILIGFSTKFNKYALKKIISICSKLKIVKDKDKAINKYQIKLDEFHESAQFFRKNKLLFFETFMSNFFALGIFYMIPLFILFSMNEYTSLNLLTTIVCSAYVLMIGSFIPIPGGSGGIEYGFLQFFGTFIVGPLLTAVLLLWRFITYYFGIIFGAIMLNVYRRFDKK